MALSSSPHSCYLDALRLEGEFRTSLSFASLLSLPLTVSMRLEMHEGEHTPSFPLPSTSSFTYNPSITSYETPLAFPQEFTFPALQLLEEEKKENDDERTGRIRQQDEHRQRETFVRFVFLAYTPVAVRDERQVLLFCLRDSVGNVAGRASVTYAEGRRWRRLRSSCSSSPSTLPSLLKPAAPSEALDYVDKLFVDFNDEEKCLLHLVAVGQHVSFGLRGFGSLNFAKPQQFLSTRRGFPDERYLQAALRRIVEETWDCLKFEDRENRQCQPREKWRHRREKEQERPYRCRCEARGEKSPSQISFSVNEKGAPGYQNNYSGSSDSDDGIDEGDSSQSSLSLSLPPPPPPLILAGAHKLPIQALLYDTDHHPWPREPDPLWDYQQGFYFSLLFLNREDNDLIAPPRAVADVPAAAAIFDRLFLTMEYASGNACTTSRSSLGDADDDDYTRLTFPDGAELVKKSEIEKTASRAAVLRRFWKFSGERKEKEEEEERKKKRSRKESASRGYLEGSVAATFRNVTRLYLPGIAITRDDSDNENDNLSISSGSSGKYSVHTVLVEKRQASLVLLTSYLEDNRDNENDDETQRRRRKWRQRPILTCWVDGNTTFTLSTPSPSSYPRNRKRYWEPKPETASKYSIEWRMSSSSSSPTENTAIPHKYSQHRDWKSVLLPALLKTSQRRFRPALREDAINKIRAALRRRTSANCGCCCGSCRHHQHFFLPLGCRPFHPCLRLSDKTVVEVQRGFRGVPVVNGMTTTQRDQLCRDEKAARYVAVW